MLNYLKQLDLSDEEIENITQNLGADTIESLETMRDNVLEVLSYLKDFGVKKLSNIIIKRPDICFRVKDNLEKDLTTLDKEFLIYIFNNSLDDLINFNI